MAVDISTLYFRWRCTYKLSHSQMDDVSDNVHFDLLHKALYVDMRYSIYTLKAESGCGAVGTECNQCIQLIGDAARQLLVDDDRMEVEKDVVLRLLSFFDLKCFLNLVLRNRWDDHLFIWRVIVQSMDSIRIINLIA